MKIYNILFDKEKQWVYLKTMRIIDQKQNRNAYEIDEKSPGKVIFNSHQYDRDSEPVIDRVGGYFMRCFSIHRLPDCAISKLREILKPAIERVNSRQGKLAIEIDYLTITKIDGIFFETVKILEHSKKLTK